MSSCKTTFTTRNSKFSDFQVHTSSSSWNMQTGMPQMMPFNPIILSTQQRTCEILKQWQKNNLGHCNTPNTQWMRHLKCTVYGFLYCHISFFGSFLITMKHMHLSGIIDGLDSYCVANVTVFKTNNKIPVCICQMIYSTK